MRPHIVVVDDDPAIVALVRTILEDEGYVTTGCVGGRNATRCIRHAPADLVVLDLQMPDVDGAQVFQALRADPRTRTLPVIFITAYADDLEQHVPQYAAQDAVVLHKPFAIASLVLLVTTQLEPNARARRV